MKKFSIYLVLLLGCVSIVDAWMPFGRKGPSPGKKQPSTKASPDTDGKDWFQQLPGESDVAFIKRITSTTPPPPTANQNSVKAEDEDSENSSTKKKKGYQRIEEWDAELKAKKKAGTLTWEERVQFEGQKYGNQVRQNDILMRQINSGR